MEKELVSLTDHEALSLLKKYGENKISQRRKFSVFSLILSQYTNFISIVLLCAGIFALVILDKVDAIFIFLVLVMNGIFGFIQEYRAEKTLQKLENLIIPQARVVRNGEEQELSASKLVPGDIVILREGDRIPADGFLLSDVMLEVDESIFTGESLPAEKKEKDQLYSGSFVMRGRAEMQVSQTGKATKLGEIAEQIGEIQKPRTPLSVSLEKLGKRLALIGAVLSLFLIPLGIVQGRNLQEVLLTSVSIAVAMVPEGLPLVVTIALAIGAYKMAKAGSIVRKMAAIETLGSTNIILTDKTGTLTQNNMSVKKHWVPNKENLLLLVRAATIANTATIALTEDKGKQDILGDKTDGALLLFAKDHVTSLEDFIKEGEVIEEKPFNPDTKTIEAVWKHKGTNHDFVRGAPESILSLLKSSSEKEEIERKLKEMGEEALRVIAFAYKKHGERHFTFLGFLGIYDPPRAEAKKAVYDAKQAGIRVVMVTGDNPVTALSIAEEIHLSEEGDVVLTSEEIAKLSDIELTQQLPRVRVFARMQPEDKLRLVHVYKQAGFVVAVTGDGVNDALALSEANIGVAMGEGGTDVAKEAADLVITDNNLNTIIKAVEEGRGIFDNIVKVVIFLFATNLVEFIVIFVGIAIGLPIPLSPTQVLWINLVGDGLPAMALATDAKRHNLLRFKPRNISENILNSSRLLLIAKIIIPFSMILIGIYVASLHLFSEHIAQHILFNALVVGEMVIIFVVRGGIFPINKFLFASIGLILLLQLLIITNPIFRGIFS